MFYFPRIWLTEEQDIYSPLTLTDTPSVTIPPIREAACPKCVYEVCSSPFRTGLHSIHSYLAPAGTCGREQTFPLLLKKSSGKHYEGNIGVDPYVLNEVATLFYLQSYSEYTQNRWYEQFSELRQAFFCDHNSDICRVFSPYPQTLLEWRNALGEERVPLFDIYRIIHALLTFTMQLEQLKIRHRGIMPSHIFLQKDKVILGGWTHASLIWGDKDRYLIDNLVYTGVTQDLKQVDRVMLANTIYYLLYNQDPPHVLQWLRGGTASVAARVQKLAQQQQKGEVRRMLSEETKEHKDAWKPAHSPRSDVEATLQSVLQRVIANKEDLRQIQKEFEREFHGTAEYKLQQRKRKQEQIPILPIIRDVLRKGEELKRLRGDSDQERRQQRALDECQQLQNIGLLSGRLLIDATSIFVELLQAVRKFLPELGALVVCTANSLFQRLNQSRFRNEIVDFPIPIAVITPFLVFDEPISKNYQVRTLDFIVFACFFVSAKLHGFIYAPSHLDSWIAGFILFVLQRNDEGPFVEFPKIYQELRNLVEFREMIAQVTKIVFPLEQSICEYLHLTLVTKTYRDIFESPDVCSVLSAETNEGTEHQFIQQAAAPYQTKDFIVLDISLLYPTRYSSSKSYSACQIEDFATDLVQNRPEILFFLNELKGQRIYFIDDNDSLLTFLPSFLLTEQKEEQEEGDPILNPSLVFRKAPGASFSSWLTGFFRTAPSTSNVIPEGPTERKPVLMQGLAGKYLHQLFFEFVKEQVKKSEIPVVSGLDISRILQADNILTFNLQLYMFLALKTPEWHIGFLKADLDADVLTWFSLIHGIGQQELLLLPLDKITTEFCQVTEGKRDEVIRSPFYFTLSESESGNPFGDTLFLLEHDQKQTLVFNPETKNATTFEPTLMTQVQALGTKTPANWLLQFATQYEAIHHVWPRLAQTSHFFLDYVGDEQALEDLKRSRWKIHLALIEQAMKGQTGVLFLSSLQDTRNLIVTQPGLQLEIIPGPATTLGSLRQLRLKQLAETSSIQETLRRRCQPLLLGKSRS